MEPPMAMILLKNSKMDWKVNGFNLTFSGNSALIDCECARGSFNHVKKARHRGIIIWAVKTMLLA